MVPVASDRGGQAMPWQQGAVSPLLTDLYQLTMLQAFWRSGMMDTAVFEFFVRKMPLRRNFLLAAEGIFVGSESDTLWMEGGQREETYKWETADACIEAMIQASARCVALARAAERFRRG